MNTVSHFENQYNNYSMELDQNLLKFASGLIRLDLERIAIEARSQSPF